MINIDKSVLEELYVNQKKFLYQIGDIFNMSSYFIVKALREHDIPIRTHQETNNMLHEAGEFRDKFLAKIKLINQSPELRAKRSKNAIAQWKNADIRARTIATNKKTQNSPEYKKRKSMITIEQWKNPDRRAPVRNFMLHRWKTNKEYRDKMIQQFAFPVHSPPNKSETNLLNLLNALYPGEWRFTGNDPTSVIGTKFPDLSSCKLKAVVELFGEHVHKPEDERKRISYFREHGYQCLVVWWKEISTMCNREKLNTKIMRWYDSIRPDKRGKVQEALFTL